MPWWSQINVLMHWIQFSSICFHSPLPRRGTSGDIWWHSWYMLYPVIPFWHSGREGHSRFLSTILNTPDDGYQWNSFPIGGHKRCWQNVHLGTPSLFDRSLSSNTCWSALIITIYESVLLQIMRVCVFSGFFKLWESSEFCEQLWSSDSGNESSYYKKYYFWFWEWVLISVSSCFLKKHAMIFLVHLVLILQNWFCF